MMTVIDDMKTGRRLKFRQSCRVAEGYIINFRSALARLRDFEKTKRRMYTLNEVDMDFQRKFVGYMVSEGLKANTIKTRMSTVHTVMREAFVRGLTKNETYNDPDFIPLPEAVDSVYLTDGQIDGLSRLDIRRWNGEIEGVKMSERTVRVLEETRDVFMMGCMTGQRFSDYSRIERSMTVNIAGYRFVRLRQRKTGITVLIPMSKRMDELLERYGGKMPKVGMTAFNRNLKILGEMMGWTWHHDTAEGEMRFCDMMSSHTARRSFATNAYQRGVPLKSIMAVTGHTSERTLRIYLRLGAKEKALMAARDFGGFLRMGGRL